MTYTRRLARGNHVYLYRVTSYREKETHKVRQKTEYMGKEIVSDKIRTVQKPKNRINARQVLDSAPYILYRFAEDFGIQDAFISTLEGLTSMREAGRRIVMLAAITMAGSSGSIGIHTGIRDGTVKEDRDLIEFIGSMNPDMISMLERSISGRIMKSFGTKGIVYDLSAIKYYGSENALARYGHYYTANGGNKEINFVLAVTRNHGIPVHHRIMPGNIVSVSTIHNFAMEIKDMGMAPIMIVMDRGFYSKQNILDLKKHSIIGSLPSTLKMHADLLSRSKGIDNSRNYILYGQDTVFHMEHSVDSIRYIVYFSASRRAEKIQAFYAQISGMEKDLHALQEKQFDSRQDMMKTILSITGRMGRYVDITPSGKTFSYRLKHNAIQARTNRMGFFILFTNTKIGAGDILRIYREKDVVEKAFMHSKPHMEPLYARTDAGTRARVFLSILGYAIMAMIVSTCGLTYGETERIMSGIREVVYTNGTHSVVELTKDQKVLLDKLSIEL